MPKDTLKRAKKKLPLHRTAVLIWLVSFGLFFIQIFCHVETYEQPDARHKKYSSRI